MKNFATWVHGMKHIFLFIYENLIVLVYLFYLYLTVEYCLNCHEIYWKLLLFAHVLLLEIIDYNLKYFTSLIIIFKFPYKKELFILMNVFCYGDIFFNFEKGRIVRIK